MILEDTFELSASVEDVWKLLDDFPRVAPCLPGARLEGEVEPGVYAGSLGLRIGPVQAQFSGQVRVTERAPGERLAASIAADDPSSATNVRATFQAWLSPMAAGTQIRYRMDLALRGRLAQFGTAVVHMTAKKMTAQFVRCLEQLLASPES